MKTLNLFSVPVCASFFILFAFCAGRVEGLYTPYPTAKPVVLYMMKKHINLAAHKNWKQQEQAAALRYLFN